MKKNISINISGIIFHIEEDGYEQLKGYLDSISEYFSTFQDSKEIISDIENRIAEIFLSKLNDEKQVITPEDVKGLIATMGKIEDFQAIEDPEEETSGSGGRSDEYEYRRGESERMRDLKRDNSRKLLGGVCAGIAAYFRMDPLWVRLITVALLFATSGIIAIVYLILWAILPATEVQTESDYKKMFRDPEDKVIAGVSSGVANYFGIDVLAVRLLFVVFIFVGGSGLIAYIVLWIILPEAKSITEKVQMKGEPVTLSNIESNVKKRLNVGEGEEENIFVKIILFPFRLIAIVLNALSRALGPFLGFVVDFLRILVGIAFVLFGILLAVGVIIAVGTATGLLTGGLLFAWTDGHMNDIHEPFFMIMEGVPSFVFLVAFITAVIPSLFIILLGISIIAKRIVFNATVGWTLLGLWLLSAGILSTQIPAIVYTYHDKARYEETRQFPVNSNTLYLTVNELRGLDDYETVDISFRGHEGAEVLAELEITSRGSSREDAIEHARKLNYGIEQQDSLLVFDYGVSFPEGAKFMFQELDIVLDMPYGQPFVMDRSMRRLLSWRAVESYGYRHSQVDDENRWVFTEEGLECLTCDRYSRGYSSRRERDEMSRIIDTETFRSIQISSPLSVEIRQGDEIEVEYRGREEDLSLVDVRVMDGVLDIFFKEGSNTARNFSRTSEDIRVLVTVPRLLSLDLSQASRVLVERLSADTLQINLNGASAAEIRADIRHLYVQLDGNSELDISGRGNTVEVDVNGSSSVEGFRYRVEEAVVRAYGGSSVKIHVTDTIQVERDLASTVRYRGGARPSIREDN